MQRHFDSRIASPPIRCPAGAPLSVCTAIIHRPRTGGGRTTTPPPHGSISQTGHSRALRPKTPRLCLQHQEASAELRLDWMCVVYLRQDTGTHGPQVAPLTPRSDRLVCSPRAARAPWSPPSIPSAHPLPVVTTYMIRAVPRSPGTMVPASSDFPRFRPCKIAQKKMRSDGCSTAWWEPPACPRCRPARSRQVCASWEPAASVPRYLATTRAPVVTRGPSRPVGRLTLVHEATQPSQGKWRWMDGAPTSSGPSNAASRLVGGGGTAVANSAERWHPSGTHSGHPFWAARQSAESGPLIPETLTNLAFDMATRVGPVCCASPSPLRRARVFPAGRRSSIHHRAEYSLSWSQGGPQNPPPGQVTPSRRASTNERPVSDLTVDLDFGLCRCPSSRQGHGFGRRAGSGYLGPAYTIHTHQRGRAAAVILPPRPFSPAQLAVRADR
ncbi:hypothetical protein BT67DRAFT_309792 [Trichocladium antarcticum]|uniref:Uncharacterized protein n=1 Tax=Trichocladium antarcticum TaxID=1450529 RepID=A0AAN6UJY6_9PEZI|nr:hypothetical protein BT67DRAFT_309792 [Trichocladium antarcticum]